MKFENKNVIVEDEALCFNALNGMPGPYIKDFLKRAGPKGLYDMVKNFDDKTAYVQFTITFKTAQGETNIFSGKCHGKIVPPKAESTGWECIF